MTDITRLLNTTSAGMIAQELDARDKNGKDNKIEASIWNAFIKDKGGKTVKNFISVTAAMNSITTYVIREAKKLGKNVEQLALEWLNAPISNSEIDKAMADSNDSQEVKNPKQENPVNENQNTLKNETVIVKDILAKAGLVFEEKSDLDNIVNKYNALSKYYKDNNLEKDARGLSLEDRIINYAKGLKFINFEKTVTENDGAVYDNACSDAKTFEGLKAAYKQFGTEYVEAMDISGDGKIDAHEMFYTELVALYESQGDNNLVAKQKALEVIKKFANYNAMNLPEESDPLYDTEDMAQFSEILNKIGFLDKDKDMTLSPDEAAAYLLAMAQLSDKKNDITARESINADIAIMANGMSKDDIMELFNVSAEDADMILTFSDKLKAAQELLNSKAD